MLTAVKNQLKVCLLTTKYAIMREMLNKFTFMSKVVLMMLNNASFLIQWVIIYSLKDSIGTYGLKDVMLLWAFSSASYGVGYFFFKNAFLLSKMINEGKIDQFIIQPKNVLLSIITTDIQTSALGDMLYGLLLYFIYGFSPSTFILFILFSITGGLIMVSCAIIIGSLSFWFGKSEVLLDTFLNILISTSLYPDTIYGGVVKIILYTVIPVGLIVYLPISVIKYFNPYILVLIIVFTIAIISFAYYIFNKGLKRYSSSNLMNARV